jgi:hypothetical protein
MSSVGAAPRAAIPTSSARAEASRRNGARSRGPKTPEGKARSSRNALKHGMRAEKHVVLPDEDAAEFKSLTDELAPEDALQSILVGRIARAAWRLERAERLEVELFEERRYGDGGPGLALIRDRNGTRSFETLLRYRGAALAELSRAAHAQGAPGRSRGTRRSRRPSSGASPRSAAAGDRRICLSCCITRAPRRPRNRSERTRAPRTSLRTRPPERSNEPERRAARERPEPRPSPARGAPPAVAGRARTTRSADRT